MRRDRPASFAGPKRCGGGGSSPVAPVWPADTKSGVPDAEDAELPGRAPGVGADGVIAPVGIEVLDTRRLGHGQAGQIAEVVARAFIRSSSFGPVLRIARPASRGFAAGASPMPGSPPQPGCVLAAASLAEPRIRPERQAARAVLEVVRPRHERDFLGSGQALHYQHARHVARPSSAALCGRLAVHPDLEVHAMSRCSSGCDSSFGSPTARRRR